MSDPRQWRDEWLVELDLNIAGVMDVDEENDVSYLAPVSVDPSSIMRTMIEDERKTGESQGKTQKVQGLWNINVPLTAYLEGIRDIPAVGSAPVQTAFSNLIAAAMQDRQQVKRTKAKAGATTTVIDEQTDDGHAVTGIGLAAFSHAVDGTTIVRPYTYTAATDRLTLLIALPAAPALDDEISAAFVFDMLKKWDADALPYPLVARTIGNDDKQNHRAWGGVAGLTIPQVGPEEVPRVDAAMQFPQGQFNFARPRPTFAEPRVNVFAGARVTLAKFGSTSYKEICGYPEFKIAGQWQRVTCPNLLNSVQGWMRGASDDSFALVVPHTSDPSDVVGGAIDDWREYLEAGATDDFQGLVQYGSTLGRIFAEYGPRLVLREVEQTTLDNADARRLVFEPSALAVTSWVTGMM